LVAVIAVYELSSFIDAVVVERDRRDANTWIVTSLETKPYLSSTVANPTKNEDYEGYIPDLLAKIRAKLNQNYKLQIVADRLYGSETRGVWNGMIGEVKDGKADVAAAPITVSDNRKNVVDFTKPFMTFSTVFVVRKPANGSQEFKTLHDLISQPGMKFGVLQHGTTEQFISQSPNQDLARLNIEHVRTQEEGIERVRGGNFAFIIEAITAEYWTRKAPCDLVEVKINDSDLKAREYAFAAKKNAGYTTKLNQAMDELRASGELEELKRKWWKDECKSSAVSALSHSAPVMIILSAFLSLLIKTVKY